MRTKELNTSPTKSCGPFTRRQICDAIKPNPYKFTMKIKKSFRIAAVALIPAVLLVLGGFTRTATLMGADTSGIMMGFGTNLPAPPTNTVKEASMTPGLTASMDTTQITASAFVPNLGTDYNFVQIAYGSQTEPQTQESVVYPVWFATNRKPAAQGVGFTGARYDRITRGRVEVYIPEAHRFGETGSSFWKRLLRFDLRDDRLRVQHIEPQERDALFAEIRAAMLAARDSGEKPHASFFLHGFNVTFEEAAIRAAQIGYDLKVPGATAFFSWPSRGSVEEYTADEATIEASEQAITDFLVDFTANCGAEKVDVIAHSMGNRGLLRALQRIAANAETRGKVKFGQIILAAPDVDRDLFLDLGRLYLSTPNALRSTPPTAICRCIFLSSCMPRRVPVILNPTPWFPALTLWPCRIST